MHNYKEDTLLIWSHYYIKCIILGKVIILNSNFGDLPTKLLKSNDEINICYNIYNPKTIKDKYENLWICMIFLDILVKINQTLRNVQLINYIMNRYIKNYVFIRYNNMLLRIKQRLWNVPWRNNIINDFMVWSVQIQ